jgi:hypothetical protein
MLSMKSTLSLLLSIILLSCGQGGAPGDKSAHDKSQEERESDSDRHPEDEVLSGRKCATIQYHNPKTGKSSEYTLFVDVENNHLVRILFPDGYMDTEHFTAPEIKEDGTCSFTNDRGYRYNVQILQNNTACTLQEASEQQCSGITKSGNRCKRSTSHPSGRCYQHR